MKDALDHVLLDRLRVDALGVLRRDEDALDLDRRLAPRVVDLVTHRHLRLAVRPEVAEVAGLPNPCKPLADPVREDDRERHQLRRLVRGVAEHHPLVARADPVDRIDLARLVLQFVRRVDAERDVGRLGIDRDHDPARVRVEAVLGVRVADAPDRLPDDVRHVDVRGRGDLAADDGEPGRDHRLARDTAVGVVAHHGVQNRVGDLVGDLVGVPLGDRLRGEEEVAGRHLAAG
jgi:hypothetical protein